MGRSKTSLGEHIREWGTLAVALGALVVAIKACSQSDDSFKLAQESHKLALRNGSPEFKLETDPLGTDLKPGPLKISARVKNVGTTTAFRVVSIGRIDEGFQSMPKSKASFNIPSSANRDIEPQQSVPVSFGPEIELTAEDIENLKNGRIGLAFDVWVRSDSATPGAERPSITFRRAYDRRSGEWTRGFPGGNPDLETR
jgi:hypothetical protein